MKKLYILAIFAMISFELTAQDLSENSYYKLAKGQPFKFTFKGIGGILQYLDTNIIIEDSVGIKDSYIIHNNRKEIVVCDFVDGGGKYQIHPFASKSSKIQFANNSGSTS